MSNSEQLLKSFLLKKSKNIKQSFKNHNLQHPSLVNKVSIFILIDDQSPRLLGGCGGFICIWSLCRLLVVWSLSSGEAWRSRRRISIIIFSEKKYGVKVLENEFTQKAMKINDKNVYRIGIIFFISILGSIKKISTDLNSNIKIYEIITFLLI